MIDNTNIKFADELATNLSDFPRMVREYLLIDKTDAIRDFITCTGVPTHLILKPRRSGKTLLLSMMQTYFEAKSAEEDIDERKKLFTSTPLKVTKEPFFEKHFAKYPVIKVDLSYLGGGKWKNMHGNFINILKNEYLRHKKRGDFDNVTDKDHLTYIKSILESHSKDPEDYQETLRMLSEILFKASGGAYVIVLIDEYDKPQTASSIESSGGTYDNIAVPFFKTAFHRLLKDNSTIRGAVVTGILHLAQTGFLSGLNTLIVFGSNFNTFKGTGYSTALYLTPSEVKKLYNHFKAKHGEKLGFTYQDLVDWYSGNFCDGKGNMFNVCGVLSAFAYLEIGCYWTDSANDELLRRNIAKANLETKKSINALIKWEEVKFAAKSYRFHSKSILRRDELLSMLNFAGYLTLTADSYLKIPNKEVHSRFSEWVEDLAKAELKSLRPEHNSLIHDMFLNCTEGDFRLFKSQFQNMVMTHLSYWLIGRAESVHSAFIFGIFLSISRGTEYEVTVEEEAGTGRMDMLIASRNGVRAVIIEFKVSGTKSSMHRDALTALDQIEDRKYRIKVRDNVTLLREVGIAFFKKECEIVGTSLERTRSANGMRAWRVTPF